MKRIALPAGWAPVPLDEGYLNLVGPLYAQRAGDGSYRIAFRAGEAHLNRYGVVHGGMLATLADVAIGMNLARVTEAVETTLTLNLALDFIDASGSGDWIEARVSLIKRAGRVRFGDCELCVGERVIARGHATFYAPRPGA
ncbi:PaaI family thioesterase [Piscinibacter sp.]|uniref:PaaI family thioesterase n=1 Tax=Piscinibacter sp. TaxID=1903157 RepID=UPI0039E522F8